MKSILRITSLGLIFCLSSVGLADRLQAIELRAPADENTIRGKCMDAFTQWQADREELETREKATCLSELNRGDMENLKESFLAHCSSTFQGMTADQIPGAKVVLTVEVLNTIFMAEYARPYYQPYCMDKLIGQSQVEHYQQQSSSGSQAVSERCGYAFRECQ